MKRIVLLMTIMAVSLAVSARMPFNPRPIQQQNNSVTIPTEVAHGPQKHMTRFDAALRIPEGELKTYNRSGQYVYVKDAYLYRGFQTDKMDIVYADNHVVYIKNILCGAKTYFGDDFWVQGTINEDGTMITVPLGQAIYTDESNGAEAVLGWGSTIDNGTSVSYQLDESVTEVIYSVNGETISFVSASGLVGSGYDATGLSAYWSDDDSWTGFLEGNTVFTQGEPVAAPEVIYEIPENCAISTYAYRGECINGNRYYGWTACATVGKIDVAFAGDDIVYIHNPMWWHNDYNTWVKGTYDRETGIVTVPTGQYLAWSDKLGYGIQLKWGSSYIVENGIDENGNTRYELRYSVDEYTKDIRYKIENDKIYLLGCNGSIKDNYPYNYASTSMMAVFSDNQSLDAMELNLNGTELSEETGEVCPYNPYVYVFIVNEWASQLYFDLPSDGYILGESGSVALDPERMSYSVYYDDDQLFVFNQYEYDLPNDMDEIPFSIWNNGGWFYDNCIYFPGCDYWTYPSIFDRRIGLQVHYYSLNGAKNSSDIIYCTDYQFDPITGINEPLADKSVSSVHYYNIMGQEIPAPEGITIQVTTYSDGTRSASKLIR